MRRGIVVFLLIFLISNFFIAKTSLSVQALDCPIDEVSAEGVVGEEVEVLTDTEGGQDGILVEDLTSIEPVVQVESLNYPTGLILNEIAFKESNDWLELRVIEAGDYTGFQIFQSTQILATIPDIGILNEGALITFAVDSINGFLMMEKSLTGTDNILTVRDPEDVIIDAVIWSNQDGKFTKSITLAQDVIDLGFWGSSDFLVDDQGAWGDSDDVLKGLSLIRILESKSKDAWQITNRQTPNQENKVFQEEELSDGVDILLVEEPIKELVLDSIDDTTIQEAANMDGSIDDVIADTEESDMLEYDVFTVESVSYGGLRINEFIPDPEGTDSIGEWIELYNSGSDILLLDGWFIDDQESGSKPFSLNGLIIEPEGFLILKREQTSIALNNSNDSVRLLTPLGDIHHEVSYDKAITASSFNYIDSVWKWSSSPTMGEVNLIKSILVSTSISKSKLNKIPQEIQAYDLKNQEKNTLISLKGVVISLPNIFTKGSFHLDNGVEVYFSKAEFPELLIGQSVHVTGLVSEKLGNKRIKMRSIDDLQVLGDDILDVIAQDLSTDEVGSESYLRLVKLAGKVSDVGRGFLYLDDGLGEIKVKFKKNILDSNRAFLEGDNLTVVGIIGKGKEAFELWPRMDSDVIFELDVSDTIFVGSTSDGSGDSSGQRSFAFGYSYKFIFFFIILLMVIAASVFYLSYKKIHI